MALDQLTSLLHRWQTAGGAPGMVGPGGRLDRTRVVAEAGRLLRGLSVDERRDLGRALAEGGVDHLAAQLDPHLPPPPAWEQARPPAEQLLDLDVRTGQDLLMRLDAVSVDPPPPPPPVESETQPVPPPGPVPPLEPEPLPEPPPLPEPEPLPEREPLPEPPPLPEPEPLPDPVREPLPPAATGRNHRPAHAEARLRAIDDAARDLERPQDALALLRRFPDGWQRRRAAQRLLEQGLLARVDPLDVLQLFARQGDRTRVAAALLQLGELDLGRVGGLLPDGTIRRLARRAARSVG